MTGRARVLLSRVSLRYPFLMAEVRTSFRNNNDVFHALRGSCHVPIIGGIGPYRYDGHAYFDGFFWPQMLVPWKGSLDDFMVRVSAFSVPSSDIRARLLPPWWALFPPREEVLRGVFWMGYQDAARWFAKPAIQSFELCGCRDSKGDEDETSEGASSATWSEARKLLLHTLPEQDLPELDSITGLKPAQFVDACTAAIEREFRIFIGVIGIFLAVATAFLWVV